MKKSILEINNLSVGFKEAIFKNINAIVLPGTLTALMGVNGVGKSCFLKTLANLNSKCSGDIKLLGIKTEDYSVLDFSKVVSLVLTEKIQIDYLRVNELVAMGQSPYSNWLGKIDEQGLLIIKQVMDQVGILPLADRLYSELSDGQKQKVLIARALAQRPKLLILDEPTTYIDIPSKIELLQLLKTICSKTDIAIIMSTHDIDLVKVYSDQVWLMGNDGEFFTGGPEAMESSGLFRKCFYMNKF
jgi:iron complex transport system ATP-binding protein